MITKEEKILLKMFFKFLKQNNAYNEYKNNTINATLTNWKYNDDKQIGNALNPIVYRYTKMENNQINGQKISKEAYCPNPIFNNGNVSIGEFKTIEDAMNFPIKEIWCIDNKFQSYKSQGSRLLIICSWNRSIQDSLKFVVAVIYKDTVGKVYYWDMNDLPLYPEERKNQYEDSLGDDATYTLYQMANNKQIKL